LSWLLLALHGVLLLHSHAFSLPYIDHPDEPAFYLAGQVWRGAFEMGSYMRGYPPAYIALELGVAQLAGALGFPQMAHTIQIMRLISVLVSCATLWFILSAARQAANHWAALVAGSAWVASPYVLAHGVYATPDPFVYLTVAWALWLSIRAVKEGKAQLAISAMGVGALSVFVKFQVVPSLLAGIATLFLLLRDRRLGLRVLGWQAAIVILTAALLLGVFRSSDLLTPYEDSLPSSEIGVIRREGSDVMLRNLVDPQRVLTNIGFVFLPMGGIAALLFVLMGAGAWLASERTQRTPWQIIALCGAAVVAVPWVMAAFTLISVQRMRDALPAATALCVLMGIAAVQLWQVLRRWRLGKLVYSALGGAWLLLTLLPHTQAMLAVAQERGYGDWRTEIRQWADVNLSAGWVAVPNTHAKTFNPFWGGLQGTQWFDWLVYGETFTDQPLAYWRDERGIAYLLIERYKDERLRAAPDTRAYLEAMLHLKTFAAPPHRRGQETVLYRTTPIQTPLAITFGDLIVLRGMAHTAETATFNFYWQALHLPQRDYSLYLHLTPLDSRQILAQADGAPTAQRPTTTWADVDEIIIGSPFRLAPAAAITCGYRVLIGLYDSATGERLLLPNGEDYAELLRLPCANAE
jgi:4-amino-4-deoxy-L-arabinose transferase-like glycosyltransferase